MDRRIDNVIVSLVLALTFLVTFSVTPAYATQLYTSTYRFDKDNGPLYRFDDVSFNLIHLSLDSRVDTLEDFGTNIFSTIAVSGEDDVVADGSTDTLTFVAGSNMTLTNTAASNSIQFDVSTTPLDILSGGSEIVAGATDIDFEAANFAVTDEGSNEAGVALADNLDLAGYIDFVEIAAPGNPAANDGRLYVADATGTTTIYFKDSAGVSTSLMTGASDEAIQDIVGAMMTGTQTLITVTYQDSTADIDHVVNNDLGDAGWDWSNVVDADITNTLTSSIFKGSGSSTNAVDLATAEVAGTLAVGNIADEYLRNNTDDITTGSLTLDDGVGDSPPLVLTDGSDASASWTKLDAGGSEFNDTGAMLFKVSGDTDDYIKMLTTDNRPELTFVGSDGTITAAGGTIGFDDDNLATSGTFKAGTTTIAGVINTEVGLDAVGAVDLDYGSGDVTDHTFATDGTGTSEIVLPAGSIDSTEILDNTLLEVDLKAVDASADEDILTKEDTTGDFEWHSFLQIAVAQTGAVDFGDTTSFEIPNANDVTANTTLGMLSLDADDLILYFGDGINLVPIGGGTETLNALHVNFVAPATAFAEFAAIDIQLDVSSLAATSLVHGINIAAVGSTSGTIVAMGTHSGIIPILQLIGTFQSVDQTTPDAYAGEYPSGGSFDDGIDGKTVFEAVNDEIYIGAVAIFSELEVMLSTPCSKDENLVFEYQHTDTSWDVFAPEDGTEGFEQSGIIEWTTLTNWKSDSDPGGADGAAGYWIRIRRTRAGSATDPIVTTIKTLDPVEYEWDETGKIIVTTVVANLFDADGAVDMDYGSGDVTDHTFTTDSTGDAEIVLPDSSIGAAELLDFGTLTQTLGNILMSDGTDFESVATGIYHVPNSYATIQAGINAAEAAGGGLVKVAAGTYDEKLVIDDTGVTLEGAGAGRTIIDEDPDTGHALTVTAAGTTLRGFAISTDAAGGDAYNAIQITNVSLFLIENVTVSQSDNRGISISNGDFGSIRNCFLGAAGGTIDDTPLLTNNTSSYINVFNVFTGGTISGANSFSFDHDFGQIIGNHIATGTTRSMVFAANSTHLTGVGNKGTGAFVDSGASNVLDANNNL